MAITLQQVKDAVDAEHAVVEKLVAVVNGFPDKMAAAVAAAVAGDQAAAQALIDEANADSKSMSEALAKVSPPPA